MIPTLATARTADAAWADPTATAANSTTLRIGAYELQEELGRGATSIVYRATLGSRSYVLKLLVGAQGGDPTLVRMQFRREASAVARLSHPSLARVLEVGESETRPYLVMEFAEGESLDKRLARGPLLDDDETVTLATAVAAALTEVHRFGLVHRDIKPANIITNPNGETRLIDFGLVSTALDSEAIVGTPQYAAPEQLGVVKRAVGAPADLYSLGATLFECLTGAPPLCARAQADLLHRIATVPAPSLSTVRPETRPALAAIVARLLAKDPDDRYQSARGLLADLTRLHDLDLALRSGAPTDLGAFDTPLSIDQETPLFGRGAEIARIEGALVRAQRGEATFAQIEGEEGSGKTRLAQVIADAAEGRGALALSGKCQALETAPFGPLREAVELFVSKIARMPTAQRDEATLRVREAAGRWAPLVRRLSPGLALVLADVGEIRALEPDSELQRYYGALAGFFLRLGTPESPLLLVIDDVQWIDDGSLRVLARMAAEGGAGHVLVLSTTRERGATRGRYEDALIARGIERVELRALGLDEITELIAARLGGRGLDRPMVDKIVALTDGNPFAVGEYLRALLENGVIRPSGDRWLADVEALDAVKLPTDVEGLVVRRLLLLGSHAARLVGLAGIIGRRFSVDLLTRVAGIEDAQTELVVERMARAGLVERSGPCEYVFVHGRVRDVAVELLPEADRRDCHQAIAEAIDVARAPSSGDLYALARHYAQGHPDRDPQRTAEVNLEAGLLAIRDHAYEDACELLTQASEMAVRACVYDRMALRLCENLGRACAVTGRLDRAFVHLEEGLKHARSRQDHFRLQHLLTLTYASQGRNDDALRSLFGAFDVVGRPFPRGAIAQVIAMMFLWSLALTLRWTGLGYGRAEGEERERRKTLSQLHYTGSMIALFQGRPVLMVQFIVRDFYNVHFLGETAETAIASSVYGAALGTMGLQGVMNQYTRLGVEMAERVGDRAAAAVCRAYHAVGTKWAGDLVRGNALLVEALPELHRHVPGSWYAAMMICEQAYSYLHAGRSRLNIEHVRANAAQLERTNNLMFRYNTHSVLFAEMMVSGEAEEGAALWQRLEAEYTPLAGTIYVRLARCIAALEIMVDREETGAAVDQAIAAFQDLVSEDYYSNAARVLTGYARLIQYQKASAADRAGARRRLKEASRSLALRALVPVFRCHVPIWEAALASADGRPERARKLLVRAERMAKQCDSRRGLYHVALERARLARQVDDPSGAWFANEALELATSEGWKNKVRLLRAEFGLGEGDSSAASMTATAMVPLTRSAEQARRYADVLLQVSLASASTLDGDALARNALTELTRVLGAERALLFLLDPTTGEPVQKAHTGVGAESASQTVVRKVLQTRAPVILTGTNEGEALGSRSIMTYGLRSIMAAPLMLRDRMIGVVYLDSRLAKGMFTADDLSLLHGVSNHIAIAVETANMARLEAERAALRRDIELVGVVQNLLLPKARSFDTGRLRGAGFYRPASQCGGDWWWYEAEPDGSLLLLLGDVSGHGAAPAMITSSVAGAFHALRSFHQGLTPPEILTELDRRVRDFGGGFQMTMSVVRIDPAKQEIRFWNAAGPALFILRPQGVECVSAPGQVLGESTPLRIGEATAPFRAGDRLLMCTDGLLELKRATGRHIGPRGVARMFSRHAASPIEEVPEGFSRDVAALLSGGPQDDDITFIVLEAQRDGAATEHQAQPLRAAN